MSSVSVAIRLRPLSAAEAARGERFAWSFTNTSIVEKPADPNDAVDGLRPPSRRSSTNVTYSFAHVAGPSDSTTKLYKTFVKKSIDKCCEGFNACVFAFGETASGKTYTMLGNDQMPGCLLLAVSDIFQYVRAHSSERVFTLTASYLEIYRESLRCLFGGGVDLPIVDDLIEGGAKVVGVREEELRSPRDFIALLLRGEEQRQVAATHLNERSSRSHTIFRLRIQSRRRRPLRHSPQSDFESFSDDSDVENQRNDDLDERMATLNLVDLAGSESIAHLGDPIRRRECQFINKSLLTLERVILALATASHSRKHSLDHIPYRDSKLTRVLQSSLGGNSHVSVICTLAPSSVNRDESHKTLRFGSFARNVLVSAPRVNTSTDDQAQVMLRRYASTIADLRNQIRNLDAAIKDSQHDQETMRSLELENRAIALRLKEEQRSKQLLIARLNLAQTSTASLPMESAPSSDDDPTRSLRSLSLSPVQSSPRKPMSSHSNTFVSAQSDVELRSSNSSQSSVKSGSTARRPGMSASSLMMARARGNPSRPQPPVSTHSSKPTVLHVPKLNSVASTSNASRRRPIVSASTLETARTVVHGRSRASSSDYYLSGTSNHMSTESLSGPEIEVEASPVVFEAALSATADAPVRVPDSLIVPQLNKASASSAPALRIHSNDDEHVAAPSSLAIQVTAPSGVVTSNVVLGQSSSCLSLPLGWSEPKVVSYSASLFSPLHASHPSESQFEQTSAAKAIYCIADPLSSILADTQTLVTPVVTPAVNMHSEQLSETNSHASRPSSVASVSVVPSHQVFNDQSVLESELRQRLQAAEDNIRLLMQRFSTEVPAVTVQQNPVPSPLSESASSVAQATSALPQIDQSSDADSDELPELPELPDSSDGHEVRPKSEPELSSSAVNQSVQSASEAQSLLNQSLQEEISVAKAELEAARAAVSRANEEEARTKQAMLDLQTAVAAEKDRADNERRALKSQIDEETQLARRALLQLLVAGLRAIKHNLSSKGNKIIRLWYQPSSENLNLCEFDPNGLLCWQSEQPFATRRSFRIADIVSLAVCSGTHDTFLSIRVSAAAVINGARPSLDIQADAIIRTVLLPALHTLLPSVAIEEI